ncbi:MAG: hypothetical protein ABR567_13340 [Myxococcales bacterium]
MISVLALVAIGALFVHSCSGPRPRLVSAHMRGPVASATVRNEGPGEGEVEVEFRVQGRAGPVVTKSEKASIAPHEEVVVESRIDGARGDERVEAQVVYPPR